jgi:hypothetical protein
MAKAVVFAPLVVIAPPEPIVIEYPMPGVMFIVPVKRPPAPPPPPKFVPPPPPPATIR